VKIREEGKKKGSMQASRKRDNWHGEEGHGVMALQ
jgi:hypothetical protein